MIAETTPKRFAYWLKLTRGIGAVLGSALALGLVGAAHADQLDNIKTAGVLRCGVASGFKPFAFVADPQTRKLVGYDIDICEALAKDLEVKPEFVTVNGATRISDLGQGRVDVSLVAITHTPERAKLIDFTYNYLTAEVRVIVPVDSGMNSFTDLADKRISGSDGSNLDVKLPRVINHPRVQLFPSTANAFLALTQGKVDAMAGDETTLLGLIGADSKKYRFIEQVVERQQLGLGVKKGETRLLDAINKGLVKMEKSGQAAEFFDRWFGSQSTLKMTRKFTFSPYQTAQ